MQASIQLFEISPKASTSKASATDPCQIPCGASKQREGALPEQLNGFLEIMCALMAMPPEQRENSLAKMNSVPLEGGSATLDSLIDVDWKDVQSSQLMDILSDLNGPAQQAIGGIEAQDKAYQLWNMAKTILEEQSKISSAGGNSCLEELKNKWLKFEDSACNTAVAGGTATDDIAVSSSTDQNVQIDISGKDSIFGKDLSAAGNRMVEDPEHNIPTEAELPANPDSDDVTVLNTKSLEKIAQKVPQQSPSMKNVSSYTMEHPMVETDTPKVEDEKQLVKDGVTKPFSSEKTASAELQSSGDGNALEDNNGKISQAPSGSHQGPLPRLDARHDQEMVHASVVKESMPHDKELQTDIIRQIVQRMSMKTEGTQSRMNIRLHPEFLGNVHMQVVTENQQVTVRMMTESLAVKEIIQQNLQYLRSELQHHGLEIQKFDVFVGNDGQGWKNGQDQAAFKESLYQRQQRYGSRKSRQPDGMALSDAGHRRPYTQMNLNEIDYFA